MKPRRFVVASDNHGDMVDADARRALMDFIADYKPEIRIHAGDNWDFRNLRKGAGDDEKAVSLEDDWQAGSSFISEFFAGGKEKVFLRGNHDERLWHFKESATGLLRDYAADGIKRIESIIKRAGATMLPYDAQDGVYELGKLTVIHGYHAGIGAAKEHANAYHSDVLFGHVHAFDSISIKGRNGPITAQSIGCLCRKNMGYINAKTAKLRWGQGWAYGVSFPDGTYQLFQTRNINGKFYAATEIKSY